MADFRGHLHTINRHRRAVVRNCFRAGIGFQGLGHDLSKYSPTEFWRGVKYYQGNRSPNAREREIFGYSTAWMHHKGRNRHHFEYWSDFSPAHKCYMPVKMPVRYTAEMFCDRIAASKVYKGDEYTDDCPLRYFSGGSDGRRMHPDTAQLLKKWLTVLAERGEKEAFALVKADVSADRKARRAKK